MNTALTLISGLLMIAGLGICLINYGIVLHNLLRGTHSSMLPLLGTMSMVLALIILPRMGEIPEGCLWALLLFDLSGLPSLLLLPFYLLTRPKESNGETPPQPQPGKAVCVILYMLLVGIWVLSEGLRLWPGE